MALFERGQELVAICNRALDRAELRLQKVRTASGGTFEVVPLEEPGEM
jgi:exonuclease VII small subunit